MEPHIIFGIVALACFIACGMIGAFTYFNIVDEVNDKLPKEEQFGWLGWYLDKVQRLHREYKSLHPDRRLLLKAPRGYGIGDRLLGNLRLGFSIIRKVSLSNSFVWSNLISPD
jgi:hypothetical protein